MKFTKGDIVTELDKLQFYQRKHLDRLLVEDIPDSRPAQSLEPILRAVANDIQALEASRASSTSGSPKPPGPGLVDVSSLGELHPTLRIGLEGGDEGGRQQYVLAALRLLKNKVWPLEGLVADNRYVFWRPSRPRLLETLDRLKEAVGDVVVDGSAGGVREALVSARRVLEPLPEDSWTAVYLSHAIGAANASISCRDRETGKSIPHAAFRLWRWAMAASDPGPPVYALLELIGRHETLARLDVAIELLGEHDST